MLGGVLVVVTGWVGIVVVLVAEDIVDVELTLRATVNLNRASFAIRRTHPVKRFSVLSCLSLMHAFTDMIEFSRGTSSCLSLISRQLARWTNCGSSLRR